MKGQASAATLGLVGGLALGIWIGSEMTSGRQAVSPEPAVVAEQGAETTAANPQPAKPRRVSTVARSTSAAVVEAPAPESAPRLVMTVPVSAPEPEGWRSRTLRWWQAIRRRPENSND